MKGIKVRLLAGVLAVCMAAPQTAWGAGDDLSASETVSSSSLDLTEEKEEQTGEAAETLPQEVQKQDTEMENQDTDREETETVLDEEDQGQPEEDPSEEDQVEQPSIPENPEWSPGWCQEEEGMRYYNEDGSYTQNDFLALEDYSYYFDENGYLVTGWQTIEDEVYYFKKTGQPGIKGAMFTGWQSIGGYRYYFGTDGKMALGWLTYKEKVYYLKQTGDYGVKGRMLKGWQSIGGYRYHFDSTGSMSLGWLTSSGKVYYLKKTGDGGVKGRMLKGWQSIGGYRYYFGTDGKMALGWQTYAGKVYYLKQTGDYGIKGRMLKGWQSIGGSRFYFGTDGKMALGWLNYKGKVYYLKQTGDGGVKGRMLTGWQNISGKTYYFGSSGAMVTGWKDIGKYRFYFKATGANGLKGQMFTGMQSIARKKYYFKQTGSAGVKGAMMTNYTYKAGASAYHFGSDGVGEKLKMYTLSFYSATGSSEYTKLRVKVYKGEKYKLPEVPDRLNYSGVGWSLKKNATVDSAVEPGATITVTGNMKLYGCWEKAKSIQFFYNSGTGEYLSLRENVTGDSLILPDLKSASGYTFLGWSDKPKQNASPKYRAGERISVTKGMKLYSVVIKNPVPGPESINQSQEYDRVFFIGDSRTVGMQNQISGLVDNVTFICENRVRLDWFKTNRATITEQIKSEEGRIAVIWNLGVNDLTYNSMAGNCQLTADAYISEMEQLAKALSDDRFDLYFMSVNPLNEAECMESGWGTRSVKWLLDFNYLVRTGLKSYRYIDTYNYLINTGFQLTDGLHYTPAVYGKIYNKAIDTIDSYAES